MTHSLQTIAPARPERSRVPVPDEPRGIPLRRLLAGICRNRRLILGAGLAAAAIGGAFAWHQPVTYLSEATFLMRRGGEEISVAPFQPEEGPARNPVLASNAPHVLLSEELCRRVVAAVGAERIVGPDADAGPDDAALAFRAGLTVSVPRSTSIVQVTYEALDPDEARALLDVYLDAAVAHHVEVYADRTRIELVVASHAAAEAELARQRAAYETFLTELGVTDFETELEARSTAVQALRADVQNLENSMQSRRALCDALIARTGAGGDGKEVTIDPTLPSAATVEARIAEQDALLLTLRARLKPHDAAIAQAERSLVELRAELDRARLRDLALLLDQDRDALAQAHGALASAESARRDLARHQDRHRVLRRELDARREQLELGERDLARARAKELSNRNEVSSLTVLDRASRAQPAEHSQKSKIVFGALFAGLCLGLLLTLLQVMTDRTVRTVDDLEEIDAVPILALIPHLDHRNLARHDHARRLGC